MMTLSTKTVSIVIFFSGAVLLSAVAPVIADSDSLTSPTRAQPTEICFPTSAGFNNKWPFAESAGKFPESPEAVGPIFELYTAQNHTPQRLNYTTSDASNVNASTSDEIQFYPQFPTKFIIHGFGNALGSSAWITDMRKAFQQHGDYNIVLVGWDTAFPSYVQAICNSRVIAQLTVSVIQRLQQGHGLDLSDLHLIGHSLGAHVSSYVGRLMDSKVARITGLDPAGPWFDTFNQDAKLDPSDAQFVDVIHTNGQSLNLYGGFGLLEQSGHVDFYPNGGEKQPGCLDGVVGGSETFLENFFQGSMEDMEESVLSAVGCSHGRAYEIFTESINTESCRFKAFPCISYAEFERGTCRRCGSKGCNYAGLQASPYAEGGKQYLQTSDKQPLCCHSIVVTIVPAEQANALEGSMTLTIQGSRGEDTAIIAPDGPIYMWEALPWRTVVPVRENIGEIQRAALSYKRRNVINRRWLRVSKLVLEDLLNNKKYSTLREFRIKNDMQVKLRLWKTRHDWTNNGKRMRI